MSNFIDHTIQTQIGKAFLTAYMEAGPASLQGSLDGKTKSPIREAVLSTAKASVRAVKALSKRIPMELYLWRNVVMNRVLRGILWTINNGNAPRREPSADSRFSGENQNLECSLSSKVIDRLERSPETVYIS